MFAPLTPPFIDKRSSSFSLDQIFPPISPFQPGFFRIPFPLSFDDIFRHTKGRTPEIGGSPLLPNFPPPYLLSEWTGPFPWFCNPDVFSIAGFNHWNPRES